MFAELDRIRRLEDKNRDHLEVNEARAALRRSMNEADAALAQRFGRQEETAPEQPAPREIRAGDTVRIKSMNVKAAVAAVNPDGTLALQAGIMKVSARPEEVVLEQSGASETKKALERSSAALRSISVAPEIDLRGTLSDEAVLMAERYIDSAVLARLRQVTIIHGKGTGALRQAIQSMLKKNRQVKSFRNGTFGEGEMGVTVVELR